MRIGLMAGTGADVIDGVVEQAKQAEAAGFSTLWLANIFGLDAITAQQPDRVAVLLHLPGQRVAVGPARARAAAPHEVGREAEVARDLAQARGDAHT